VTFVDVTIVLLGLVVFGLGLFQFATGRILVGWRPRTQRLPPSFFRAYAAAYAFLGMLIAWTVVQRPLGPTFQSLAGAVLSMGFIVSASWAFVLAVRSRPAR
jgi:hypothetical protein